MERQAPPRHPVVIDLMRKLALAAAEDRLRVWAEGATTLVGFACNGLMRRPDANDALRCPANEQIC